MRLLEAFIIAFTKTFGITQPSEQARRRAAIVIAAMLLCVFLGLLAGAALLYHLGNYLPYR